MKSLDDLLRPDPQSEYCVFTYNSNNLGDYVQTLALLHHIRPRLMVFRDHFTPRKDLTLLANGWLTKTRFPTKDDYRDIRYLGIHVTGRHRTAVTASQLAVAGPVGCRDTVTEAFLKSFGVPAVRCGCVTLTFPPYRGPRKGIVCVDVGDKLFSRVQKRYGRRGEVIRTTHAIAPAESGVLEHLGPLEHYRRAYELLELYERAELVVTSRIHAALPCIAFGTPVIVDKPQDDRATVYDGLEVPGVYDYFRWFHVLPGRSKELPEPVPSLAPRERYLSWLHQSVN
jgi:hypothetical protein